jgi:hypothetical protein
MEAPLFFPMPINEFRGRPYGLTAKQKREQEQALYGLEGSTMANEEPKQTAVMDINNPPKEPYVYQRYPATLYKIKAKTKDTPEQEWDNTVVQNEAEEKDHLAKGWQKEPPGAEPEPAEPVKAAVHPKPVK